jgi:hypothetical protein
MADNNVAPWNLNKDSSSTETQSNNSNVAPWDLYKKPVESKPVESKDGSPSFAEALLHPQKYPNVAENKIRGVFGEKPVGTDPEHEKVLNASDPFLDIVPTTPVSLGKAAVKAGPTAAKAIAQGTKIAPETKALAKKATDIGMKVLPHQLTDNEIAKAAGDVSAKVPLSGGIVKNNQQAINKHVSRMIGAEAPAGKLTREAYGAAMDKSGDAIGSIAQKTKTMPIYEDVKKTVSPLSDDIQSQLTDASKFKTDHTYKVLKNYVDEIYGKVTTTSGKQWATSTQKGQPVLSGEVLQNYISKIGKQARSTTDPELKQALGKLQDTLVDHVERNLNPKDLPGWKEARKQYAIGKKLEPVIAHKDYKGDLSADDLASAARSAKSDKAAIAKGKGGDLDEAAKLAQRFVPQKHTLGLSDVVGAGGAVEAGNLLGAQGSLEAAVAGYGAANLYNRLGPSLSNALTK